IRVASAQERSSRRERARLRLLVTRMEGRRMPSTTSVAPFLVFERDLELGSIGFDLAVPELKILLHHLGDAKVTQGLGRSFDGRLRRLLPRLRARTDDLDDLIDALCHVVLRGSAANLPKFPASGGQVFQKR